MKLHGYFAVALSGGSTPKAIFQALAKPPHSTEIDWTKVLLFWGDERNVAPTDSESNFRMAIEAGFKNLPIPHEHIFRMKAEDDLEKHAEEYERQIKETLQGRPFDLVMLGVGEDGHTASLFPGTAALDEKTRFVVANHVPQKDTWRMTLTFPLINKAKNIALYVIGKNKEKMVSEVFLKEHTPPFPVSLIGTSANKALWILDTDAAASLLKERSS